MGTLFSSPLLISLFLLRPMAARQRSIVGIAIAMAALRLWLGWRKFPDSSGLSSDTEAPGVDETRR
jgi:hypothetical protein